ncbi:MAG: GIY-YIG nuclease family protein [Nanoarchaeota archaeon]
MCNSTQKIKSGIYKITNLITNKFYIGGSITVKQRLSSHKSMLRGNKHSNPYLQNAFNFYGEINFKFEILEYCNKDKVLEREQIWLDWCKPFAPNNGYNIVKIAGSQLGLAHTQKTKDLISNMHKGKPKTKEHVAKVALAMIGKSRPDLAARNKANSSKLTSDQARENMRKAQTGRTHSDETKLKISASNKGKLKSKEHKEKLALATKKYFEQKRTANATNR